MEHILIVEDVEKIARFIQLELEYEGYQVTKVDNGRDGLKLIKDHSFDLLILDIMLPGMNGMEVLRRVRTFSSVPIIMLTARDSVIDKVSGLDSGADDYLTKPFQIEELLARIRLHLRKAQKNAGTDSEKGEFREQEPQLVDGRTIKAKSDLGMQAQQSRQASNILVVGPLTLDSVSYEVKLDGETVQLTKREFDLLHYLLANQNIVLSRDQLLEAVWGYDFIGESNTVDVYIRYLRSKLEDKSGHKFIETVRGVGYVIRNVWS